MAVTDPATHASRARSPNPGRLLLASTTAALTLLTPGTAAACGQCIDSVARGVAWWLEPLLLGACAGLVLEVPGYWLVRRVARQPAARRRWKLALVGVGSGIGLCLLTLGSVDVLLVVLATILGVGFVRSLRAERERPWRAARLGTVALVPLVALFAFHPRFRSSDSLVNTSLAICWGPLGCPAPGRPRWPERELQGRPDAVASVEKRFEASRKDDIRSMDLPLLLRLHHELGGARETRRKWCGDERVRELVVDRGMSRGETEQLCGTVVVRAPGEDR